MKSTRNHTQEAASNALNCLPDDLRIVPAAVVRAENHLTETRLHRADKTGELPRLRIGKRCYYRLSDLRAFLNRAQSAGPIAVPWTPAETAERMRARCAAR